MKLRPSLPSSACKRRETSRLSARDDRMTIMTMMSSKIEQQQQQEEEDRVKRPELIQPQQLMMMKEEEQGRGRCSGSGCGPSGCVRHDDGK